MNNSLPGRLEEVEAGITLAERLLVNLTSGKQWRVLGE